MKKLIALTVLLLAAVLPTHAQWVVYDPSVHTQTILNGVQEVAKFVEVINNQVQQIRALTDQLNEFKHYESLFGDPQAVALNTVAVASAELRRVSRAYEENHWFHGSSRFQRYSVAQFRAHGGHIKTFATW